MLPVVVSVATMNVGNEMAPDDQLAAAIREMAPDVVALEELSRRQADAMARALEDTWPYQFAFGDSYEGRGVFSRYPLRGETVLEIASGRPDAVVDIDIDGESLKLLVAHPRPPKLKGATLDIPFALQRQLLRLADLALEASPAVLVGDFNVRPDTTIYARLRERGLLDAFAESGEGPERTFPGATGARGAAAGAEDAHEDAGAVPAGLHLAHAGHSIAGDMGGARHRLRSPAGPFAPCHPPRDTAARTPPCTGG